MTSLTQMRKIKHCKLAKLSLKVKKKKFPTCLKFGIRAGPGSQHGNLDPDRHQNDASPHTVKNAVELFFAFHPDVEKIQYH